MHCKPCATSLPLHPPPHLQPTHPLPCVRMNQAKKRNLKSASHFQRGRDTSKKRIVLTEELLRHVQATSGQWFLYTLLTLPESRHAKTAPLPAGCSNTKRNAIPLRKRSTYEWLSVDVYFSSVCIPATSNHVTGQGERIHAAQSSVLKLTIGSTLSGRRVRAMAAPFLR